MSYMTDETMDEIAQFNLDTMWSTPEALDSEVIGENDMADCVHDNSDIHVYGENETEFKVWECRDCGNVGELGKEN